MGVMCEGGKATDGTRGNVFSHFIQPKVAGALLTRGLPTTEPVDPTPTVKPICWKCDIFVLSHTTKLAESNKVRVVEFHTCCVGRGSVCNVLGIRLYLTWAGQGEGCLVL